MIRRLSGSLVLGIHDLHFEVKSGKIVLEVSRGGNGDLHGHQICECELH